MKVENQNVKNNYEIRIKDKITKHLILYSLIFYMACT